MAGFSQGGAIALRCGLQRAPALGGIVALSTWLPLAPSYAPRADGPPVLMCHGTSDNVVKTKYGVQSCEKLRTLGAAVEWKTYSMAHSAVPVRASLGTHLVHVKQASGTLWFTSSRTAPQSGGDLCSRMGSGWVLGPKIRSRPEGPHPQHRARSTKPEAPNR